MQAGKTTHGPDGQHQDVDRISLINGESTSMVWPTLGSRTANDQIRADSVMLNDIEPSRPRLRPGLHFETKTETEIKPLRRRPRPRPIFWPRNRPSLELWPADRNGVHSSGLDIVRFRDRGSRCDLETSQVSRL